ncbi:TPA: glycosyltransferase family 4 protein [Candidatus Woesearchaeota archaeon]|nr:glycosyltransferase family 4 protein [Candidatus Woesearchaeota archaeon]
MKKKVLVIGALPPPIGGMETVMEQMENINLKEYEIRVFNAAKSKTIKSNILFNVINFLYRCSKLIIKVLTEKPEIVHVHLTAYKDFLQKDIFIKIVKLLNKKLIIHIHGGAFKDFYEKSSKNKRIKIIKTLDSADSLIVLSEIWYNYFKTLCPQQKIYILPNTIDFKLISQYRRKYSKKNKRIINLLFVGRIEKQKGIFELLNAFSQIEDEKMTLNIMGPFMNNEKEIMGLIEKLGIYRKVKFLGVIHGNKRLKYFAESDIFILPSHWEGLPITILEAMASGLPIISTEVGAIPEIVKKENGVLIKVGSVSELKKAIIKVRQNTKRISYYKNNISKIDKYYNEKIFTSKLEEIYEELK